MWITRRGPAPELNYSSFPRYLYGLWVPLSSNCQSKKGPLPFSADFLLEFPGTHSQRLLRNYSRLPNRTCRDVLQTPFTQQGIHSRLSPQTSDFSAFCTSLPKNSTTYCGKNLRNFLYLLLTPNPLPKDSKRLLFGSHA